MKLLRLFRQWYNKRDTSANTEAIKVTGYSGLPWLPSDPLKGFSDDFALKLDAVYRCVTVISETIASLKINAQKRKIEKIKGESRYYFSVDEDSNLNYLLSVRPNIRQSAFIFWKNVVSKILLAGNAYIYIRREGGELKELILVDAIYNSQYDCYQIDDLTNDIHGVFPSNMVIHLKNTSTDGGYEGLSTLHFAALAMNIAYRTDLQEADLFKPGATLRGFVTGDSSSVTGYGQLQDTQLEGQAKRMNEALAFNQRIGWLPGQMKFVQTNLTPADLELLASKKMSVVQICRFFGVHPSKVFQDTSTNYKASENSQTQYMTDTIEPLCCSILDELNYKLVARPVASRIKISFNYEHYYEVDPVSKADLYAKLIQSGVYTPNEIRVREGKAPIDGGDTAFISCNVAPITSAKINGEPMNTESKGPDDGQK